MLLGLATPEEDAEEHAARLAELAEGLPAFFFARNSSLFVGERVSAEEQTDGGRVHLPAGGG